MINKEGSIKKGWGSEYIFVSNEWYCMKELRFHKKDANFSMHFHRDKLETWLVMQGSFRLDVIDTNTAQIVSHILSPGFVWTNTPLLPHKLTALEDDSVILEVSTPDHSEDNFRVAKGDSQT